MSLRAARVRNLLLLIAVFATVVAAGCWDSRRNMQRVLSDGYPVLVEITGAQYQRFTPFALDGWRPSFIEQDLSVDVKWDGRDGKPHVFKKVPVTEAFARTIVNGEQVRLAILPAKVMDDPQAVPIINADAGARLASLQEWINVSVLVAVIGWLGFGLSGLWIARARLAGTGTASQPAVPFPLRRTLFGFVSIVLGVALTFRAWSVQEESSGITDGVETNVEITSATTMPIAGKQTHVVRLSWTDDRGSVHHVGPIPVSDRFWDKITRDGELVVHQTRIRYGEEPQARPVLVDDPPERPWQIDLALGVGIALMAVGAGSLFSAAYAARRSTAT